MPFYSPLIALIAGTLLLTVSAFLSRSRLAMLGLALIVPAYALMTPLGANVLVLLVEQRSKAFEQSPVCAQVQVMVLLSGGLSRPAKSPDDFGALTTESLARVFAWRDHVSGHPPSGLTLIIAGGGPFRVPEAEVIGAYLHSLDASHQPMRLETVSKTTRESAQALRSQLPDSTHRVLLASSALHLPRAVYAFRQSGFEVCAVALNRHYIEVRGWTSLMPQSSALSKSESALHEIFGEAFYRLK